MAETPEPGCLSECCRVQGESFPIRGTRAGVGSKEGVSGIPTSSYFTPKAAKCSGEATPTHGVWEVGGQPQDPCPQGQALGTPGKGLPESWGLFTAATSS